MRPLAALAMLMLLCVCPLVVGCSTAPPPSRQADFVREAQRAVAWFKVRAPGVQEEIRDSAGYAIFPCVDQWGTGFSGGKWGRGLVFDAKDGFVGWAAVNAATIGLQAGLCEYRMLVVFNDDAAAARFRANHVTGSAHALGAAGDAFSVAHRPFEDGVTIYSAGADGLLGAVNVGVEVLRYQPPRSPRSRALEVGADSSQVSAMHLDERPVQSVP